MRRLALPVALAAALLVVPAAASAQLPTVTPTPTATPTPAPAAAKIRIKALDTHRDGARRVVVSGRTWRVSGTVTPYVAGESVTVRLYRDGKRIHTKRERLRPTANGTAGTFRTPIRRGQPAGYAVKVTHEPTAGMARARSNTLRVLVVGGSIGSGERGAAVRLLQRGLARLHYAVPRTGVYDDGTARAVMAWRKVTQRARTYTASRDVLLGVLAGRGGWKVRHPRDGRHVEADLSQQVLVLVDGDEVHRIYHTSSGAPATPTILGRFRVYRKDPGTNAKGMVHSSYFQGGYAIHGYASVPPYNASHGCLRVPVPNAWSIYEWVRMASVVWVER
jgi:hypothetical protein